MAIFATSLSVVPTASAVQLHSEERSGRAICVATFSDRETQISKDYFQIQLEEYSKLQNRLRSAYPEFSDLYEEVDERIQQDGIPGDSELRWELRPIESVGFSYGELELFALKGTSIYRSFTELAKSGPSMNVEIVPGWTKNEMISYPYMGSSVVAVGGDWSSHETFQQALQAEYDVRALYPTNALDDSPPSAALRPFTRPHTLLLESLKNEFLDSFSYETIQSSANECLGSLETGELPPVETVPTTTYAPTVTVTAEPSIVTETPEPITVTAEPSTVVVEPMPTTSTAPVETPAPVTSTVATETVTITPAPASATKERETVTVTPEPTTSTAVKPTVTVTAEPTTVTTTPTVTVSADPVEVAESKDAPAEKKSEGMGALPIIVAILAAILQGLI